MKEPGPARHRAYLIAVGTFLLVVLVVALLVLPRLDGVEVAAVETSTGAAPPTLEASVRYRLASADAGSLVVRSLSAGETLDTVTLEIAPGAGVLPIRLRARAGIVVVTAELRSARSSVLEPLHQARRRTARAVEVAAVSCSGQ